MSCGYHFDRKTKLRYWVPDCIGGSWHENYCTCDTASERERQEAKKADRLIRIEARLDRIEALLKVGARPSELDRQSEPQTANEQSDPTLSERRAGA